MDWAAVIDLKRAARNLHIETLGDWYRDPWAWPEIAWLADHPEQVVESLDSRTTGRLAKIDVPKENFAVRPAVVIEPCDRMAYQALVDTSSVSLVGDLRWWVYGWRLKRRNIQSGNYTKNRDEWALYRNWLNWLARSHPVALVTDVVSYFASIPTDRIAEDVARTSGGAVGRRISSMLLGWALTPGRTGIPQRSLASSALANRYLMPIDDELEAVARRAAPGRKYATAVRWMDDIWVFGYSHAVLRQGQAFLHDSFGELGLNMGSGKTMVLDGDELLQASKVIEHSAVDAGLDESPADLEPLEELVDRLVGSPEVAARSSARFATTRIRDSELWQYVERFVEVAERMPHAADHLARLFRDADAWSDLAQWYIDYDRSPWGCFDWAVGQFGTMFPSETRPPRPIVEYFANIIGSHRSLPLVALAAQRLSAWAPDDARPLLREAARSSQDPLERRALALALLAAGERRAGVRSQLLEFSENRSTLAMLEDNGFNPLPVSGDFK